MQATSIRVCSFVLAVFVCAGGLLAQTSSQQDDVIRTETDATNLPFTVTDQQGNFITTLKPEDVRVLEDGVPQTVFTFQRETDRALAIAFLIDISASQEPTLPDQKAAVRAFIESVFDSRKDEAALIPFTGQAYLELEMTRNVIKVYQSLQQIEIGYPSYLGTGHPIPGIRTGPGLPAPPAEGWTAIWDAVGLTATEVLARTKGLRRRIIILLTDGFNTQTRIDKKEAINRTLGAEALVYAIGIGGRDGVDKDSLREIAEKTGGRAFFPKKGADLRAAFKEIGAELRTQYLIAYSSTNKRRDGSYRRITIEFVNPDLRKQKLEIRHRPGYFSTRGA